MSTDVVPGVFDRERRALTIGILLAIGAFALEGMGVVPALPTAMRELGGLGAFGWAFSAFMLAWLVGTVGGGLLADARGPRRPMALGLAAFGGGLLLAATAGGMVQFLAGRALQGAGGGAMVAGAFVAIARGYPDALRARMMALTASVWIVPAIAGPVLSGAIAQWVGWRYVFAGIVPLLVVTAVLVLPPLAPFRVRQEVAGRARMLRAVALAVGAGLILATPDVHRYGLLAAVIAFVAGALLFAPAFRALLPPGTLRAGAGLPAGLATRGMIAFSFFGTEAFIPLGAGELRGATPTEAGLALTAGALGWIAASWIQDRLEARGGTAGRHRRVIGGFVLLAAGIAIVSAGLLTSLPLLLAPLGWGVAGFGVGLAYSAGSLICLAAAPAGQEGEVSGQLQLTEALGTAAGAGLGGALLAVLVRAGHTPREAHTAVFTVTFAIALVGALAARNLAPK